MLLRADITSAAAPKAARLLAKLSLSDWANVANVVSAVAVVTCLISVGYQIRENKVEVRTNNREQFITLFGILESRRS